MNKAMRAETRAGVTWIEVDPESGASAERDLCARLAAELEAVAADHSVTAIGIEIDDSWAQTAQGAGLAALCAWVESCPKPVIAALHGRVLGGGFELALACSFRIATADTELGLPAVTLGLVPEAGASQRLPRLIGPAKALDMLLTGAPVSADWAVTAGLLDGIGTTTDALAHRLTAAGQPRPTGRRRDGLGDPQSYLAEVAARRKAVADSPLAAPRQIVDLVEAALLVPFRTGLAMEQAARRTLAATPEVAHLRGVAQAEARARAAFAGAAPARVQTIVLLGDGAEAARTARACLSSGLPVWLAGSDGPGQLALRARIVADYTNDVQAGALTATARDQALAGLNTNAQIASIGPGALVLVAGPTVEAVAEDLTRAGAEAPPDACLAIATNDGAQEAAARMWGRDAHIGLYLPPPAHRTGLVELSCPMGPDRLTALPCGIATQLGKQPLLVRQGAAGRVTRSLQGALYAAAEVLALIGTDPAEVDAALTEAGMEIGPFEAADRGRFQPLDAPGGASRLLARLEAAGWTGPGAGQGMFRYRPGGARAQTSPEARRLVGALREASRVPAAVQPPTRDEIRQRCVLAMANAGARLMASGAVARGSDIDVAAVHGLGLARRFGGPMAYADRLGLLHTRTLMRSWTGSGDLSMAVWDPAPGVNAAIRQGVALVDWAG